MGRWGVGAQRELSWQWPVSVIRPLGDALMRRDELVSAALSLRDVPIIGKISFGAEITLTEPAARIGYKGRLFWAEAGDLIYSRIRMKQGSLAIVPATIPRVAVSNEYPVYRIRRELADPVYLNLLLHSSSFLHYIDGLSHGSSTKTRMLPENFEALPVPLPSLATQRAIVARWQKSQSEIAAARARADAADAQARAGFLAGLGLRAPAAVAMRKAFAVDSARLERWGVANVRESLAAPDPHQGKFPVVRLADAIADLENGWSPKCHPRPATAAEWGVLKLGAVSYGAYDETANKALPKELTPIPALEVRAGDTLISRANVPQLVGACAYVEATRPRLMLCDKIFRAVPHKDGPLDLRYFAEVMKTPHLRRQIESSATGASPTMQNITKPSLLGLRLPLPPLAVQQQLVATANAARAEAARERAAAAKLTAAAALSLEADLLGPART